MESNRKSKSIIVLLAVLFLFTALLTVFFWKKASNQGIENQKLATETQALELEKAMVERELDSLSLNYATLRTENEELRQKESSTAGLVAEKEAKIKKIKQQNQRDLATLRAQMEELRRIKIEYETVITTLRSENDQLRAENQRLSGENAQLRGDNSALNDKLSDLAKQLEEQIRKTQSAKFKATAFRVETERKNDKLTTRARKTREIFVSFDLADVPQNYQGAQKLYLAITTDKGVPVPSANPIKTTVEAPTGPVEIIAQQVKAVSIGNTQRISFTHKLDERIKPGSYVIAIYCPTGLLGAASFRVS